MNPRQKFPICPIFALKEKELYEHALGEDIRPDIKLPEDPRHLFSGGLVCGRRHQALSWRHAPPDPQGHPVHVHHPDPATRN